MSRFRYPVLKRCTGLHYRFELSLLDLTEEAISYAEVTIALRISYAVSGTDCCCYAMSSADNGYAATRRWSGCVVCAGPLSETCQVYPLTRLLCDVRYPALPSRQPTGTLGIEQKASRVSYLESDLFSTQFYLANSLHVPTRGLQVPIPLASNAVERLNSRMQTVSGNNTQAYLYQDHDAPGTNAQTACGCGERCAPRQASISPDMRSVPPRNQIQKPSPPVQSVPGPQRFAFDLTASYPPTRPRALSGTDALRTLVGHRGVGVYHPPPMALRRRFWHVGSAPGRYVPGRGAAGVPAGGQLCDPARPELRRRRQRLVPCRQPPFAELQLIAAVSALILAVFALNLSFFCAAFAGFWSKLREFQLAWRGDRRARGGHPFEPRPSPGLPPFQLPLMLF
eukprot:2731240-Rhodomonas_salina.7